MDLAQFEVIATLISSREPARSAARRVLVDGVANIEAAREFDLSPQSVSNTVGRFRAADATILTAYRPPKKSSPNTRLNVYNTKHRAAHWAQQADEGNIMTKDEHLEQQEAEHRERVEQQIDEDAAVFVQQGYSRSAARSKAQAISENQQAAADDITGVLSTLEEAQSPTLPDGKTAQTKAIAADLRKARS